jgi:hypothetical protein
MDLDIVLSILLVILSTMTVFSRQPFFAVFSFLGLILSMMLIYLIKGSVILSTILLLSMGSIVLVNIVQLFMNLDLEKEFQQYYKMNVVPMFGMMVMGVILGVMALVIFGSKSIFNSEMNQIRLTSSSPGMFESFDNIILLSLLGLLGVLSTSTLLLKQDEEILEEEE